MAARPDIATILGDLPSGLVYRASAPRERRAPLSTGLSALDRLLGGGWRSGHATILHSLAASAPAGGSGLTTLALGTVGEATRKGGMSAWFDPGNALDTESFRDAGLELARILWVRGPMTYPALQEGIERVLQSGGFMLVVADLPGRIPPGRTASWVRLCRVVERTTSVLLFLDHGGSLVVPGSDRLDLPPLLGRWAEGGPGLLLGAQTEPRYDDGQIPIWIPALEEFL